MQDSYFELVLYPSIDPEIFANIFYETLEYEFPVEVDSKDIDCTQSQLNIQNYFADEESHRVSSFSHLQNGFCCEFIESQSVFDYEIAHWDFAGTLSFKDIQNSQQTKIVFYLTHQPSKLQGHLEQICMLLQSRLNQPVGVAFSLTTKQNQDWIKIYQDSVMPIDCAKFHITPSWHACNANNLIPIIIDPALAFGSGHHPSTAMCLELLSTITLKDASLLDVGCGSGILSIAASKLGANVLACDTDIASIEQTKHNMQLNSVDFRLYHGSIASLGSLDFNVIVANIITITLKTLYGDFLTHLKTNGILIISGILLEHKSEIIACFSRGFRILKTLEKDGWVAFEMQSLRSEYGTRESKQ